MRIERYHIIHGKIAARRLFFAGFVACGLMVAPPADCQTYEETQEFVARKFSREWDHGLRTVISVTFTQRCRAVFDYITYFPSGTHRIQYGINFRDIDPSRINWVYSPNSTKSRIEIYVTDDQEKILYIYVSGTTVPDGSSRFYKSTWLEFPNDDRAGQQLERALRHLTELCGGKAELF